jgi:hypothetical protein
MRWREIMETASAGATGSGSVATVSTPLGMQTRAGGSMLSGKYTTDPTPNTPREYKRKRNASRRFENSPGH